MEPYDIELHALADESADVVGLEYDQALARARQELEAMQQYATAWDHCAGMPSAAYLDVLATLDRGEQPTVAQMHTLLAQDRVVAYLRHHT